MRDASKTGKKSASKREREVLFLSDDQLQLISDKVPKQLHWQQPGMSPAPSVEVPASALFSASTLVSQSVPVFHSAAGNIASKDSDSVSSTESVLQALDINVTGAIKQNIINGEYVELGQLLQRRPGPDKSKYLTIQVKSVFWLFSRSPLRPKSLLLINGLMPFLIFGSIFSSAHPDSTSGLSKYMHTVRLCARRSSGLGLRFMSKCVQPIFVMGA